MKKTYFSLLFLSFSALFAQSADKELESIVHAEKKTALKKMTLVTNPNTANYDVTYHKLEFTVDPAVYFIAGKVTTTYIAVADMASVTFDLANELVVTSVKKNNVDLAFVQNGNNELVVTLPTLQATGTSASVEITYSGAPPVNGFDAFSIQTRSSGSETLYTLSEPYGARDWWPCKQDLSDKVNAIDVYITAPAQYISVSNGIETTLPVINGANKTTHFHHGYPIPAYLICMAVTDYAVYNQMAGTAPTQYPIINYLYPEALNANITNLNQTPLLLDFYESIVTPYPFRNEKYGHAQFGWGGGMEHTTVSFMVGFSRQLIAHEMAHQWFGDKVTCGSWNDIWLNEGFATYMASMAIEHFDGAAAFITDKTNMINSITASSSGAVYLTDTEATDVNRIFSSRLSYNKGAMVLNMLRFKLGDVVFFQGLKNYLNDVNLAYGYAKTPDLQSHLEAVSGLSLTEFFNDWVYKQGYPTYTITARNNGVGQAKITINQTQSNASVSFFEMPVPVRLTGSGGAQQDFVLDNTTNGQEFTVTVPFLVTGVVFNPKKDIISRSSTATLATSNYELSVDIALYPNPTSNKLTLNLPQGSTIEKMTCYTILGQKIKETTNEISWDVSDFTKGVYFMTVVTNLGTKQLKFSKE